MRVVYKVTLALSKSQVRALCRQGVVAGMDYDDPGKRELCKRVVASVVQVGLDQVYGSAPFEVNDEPDEDPQLPEANGYSGPPGSAAVEDPPPIPPAPRKRRERVTNAVTEVST